MARPMAAHPPLETQTRAPTRTRARPGHPPGRMSVLHSARILPPHNHPTPPQPLSPPHLHKPRRRRRAGQVGGPQLHRGACLGRAGKFADGFG